MRSHSLLCTESSCAGSRDCPLYWAWPCEDHPEGALTGKHRAHAGFERPRAGVPEEEPGRLRGEPPHVLCAMVAQPGGTRQHGGKISRQVAHQVPEQARQAGENVLQQLRLAVRACATSASPRQHDVIEDIISTRCSRQRVLAAVNEG